MHVCILRLAEAVIITIREEGGKLLLEIILLST